MAELLLHQWVELGLPHLGAEEIVDEHLHLVEGHAAVHHVLVAAIHRILMGLDVQTIECLVLSEPPIEVKWVRYWLWLFGD